MVKKVFYNKKKVTKEFHNVDPEGLVGFLFADIGSLLLEKHHRLNQHHLKRVVKLAKCLETKTRPISNKSGLAGQAPRFKSNFWYFILNPKFRFLTLSTRGLASDKIRIYQYNRSGLARRAPSNHLRPII